MARLRDRLLAHGELADFLLPSFQMEGLALTLLFAGPPGVGKRLTAMALAQSLLCERSSSACGQCGSCLRVEQGHHEGLKIVEPDGTQIKIDQAREVIEFLHLQKITRARIVVIDQANLLNIQASNSLLKVLEEPPPGTFIFLMAPSPSSVLPTLRSRSRTVLFRPLSVDELRKLEIAPEWALRAARGSVQTLKALLEPQEQEARSRAAELMQSFFADPDFLTQSSWRTTLKEKGFFLQMMKTWLGFLRDGLLLKAKGEALLMNPDQKSLLTSLAGEPREALEYLTEKLLRLDAEMAFHRDPQLSLEELWLGWRQFRSEIPSFRERVNV